MEVEFTTEAKDFCVFFDRSYKKDIKKIGDIVYSTIDNDGIGLKRKYEKYKLIINRLLEDEKIIEYIKNNKEKTIKQLSNDLKISNFRIKSIIKRFRLPNIYSVYHDVT